MKYFKKFETHDPDYLNYINSDNVILPNLSYCEDIGDVHLNKVETRLIGTFNVTNTESATKILHNEYTKTYFNEIEIDGVVQPSVVDTYTFSTTGVHTVKYTLIDQTTIPRDCFSYCPNLINMIIPKNITNILSYAFENCTGLTSIIIPDTVTELNKNGANGQFQNCSNLTNVIISNSVTTIPNMFCYQCKKLTSLIIGNNVTTICGSAFAYCEFTTLNIPDNVTTLENASFYSCWKVTDLTIGSGVTTIGSSAFGNFNSLLNLTVKATVPPTLGGNDFGNITTYDNLKICVPAESVDAYKAAQYWSNYASKIQAIPSE